MYAYIITLNIQYNIEPVNCSVPSGRHGGNLLSKKTQGGLDLRKTVLSSQITCSEPTSAYCGFQNSHVCLF